MKICIDARSLRDTPTALGRYARVLVEHIAKLDRENEYIIVRRPSNHGPIAQQSNFREISLPHDISSVQNILWGARTINALKADIYHSLFHFLPSGVRAGSIVISLHDFIWVDHPALADGRRWRAMVKGSLGSLGIRKAIDNSDHIIAVSENTRKAATDAHGVACDKITTVYHGVAPEWRSGFEQPETTLPKGLRDHRFIFSLGNSLPYKNLPRLLKAFAEIADSAPGLTLVFAGRGEGKQHLIQMARSLDIADRIHFAGQLSDGEIRACFQHALFFAFPSLIEGFGLPVLEAMASGCPVLTSNCSSLAEIAGEHAVLVDPQSSASIAAGIQRLLTDPELRQQLAGEGQHRAANFTWQASAEQTLQVYHHLSPVN